MNPNLNHARFVPDKNTGRPAGIVATRRMPIDAVGCSQAPSRGKHPA